MTYNLLTNSFCVVYQLGIHIGGHKHADIHTHTIATGDMQHVAFHLKIIAVICHNLSNYVFNYFSYKNMQCMHFLIHLFTRNLLLDFRYH